MNKTCCLPLIIILSLIRPAVAVERRYEQEQRPAQDRQGQTIRLKSELVEVRAVVTDKQGQPVGNLKKEDFELLENNRPQTISFFSVEVIGAQGAPDKPIGLRARQEEPARTIVLFVDTIHISFENLVRAKQVLKRFIDEQMTEKDLAAIVTSTNAAGLLEQFTRDRTILRAGVDRLRLWQVPPQQSLFTPYLAAQVLNGDRQAVAIGTEILRLEEGELQTAESYIRGRANLILAESAHRRKVTLSTLKGVVERLAAMPGQRMIALFSEGFTQYGTGGGSAPEELQPTVSRAVRSGVVIYSIAAQGLEPLVVPASNPGLTESGQRPGRQRGEGIERPSLTTYMFSAERDLQNGLTALAKDTGGEAFFNTNDLSGRLQKVLDDNRVYYALSYQVADDDSSTGDNKFRRITVRVKNHPEYKVRAQRGYQPLKAKAEEQAPTPRQKLIQEMLAPLPATEIPIALSADYFEREGADGQVSLQVYIDAGAVKYHEQDRHYLFDLELATTIYDRTGKRVHVSTNEAQGNFTPERFEAAKQNGYRYVERVALKPGIYQVRVGVLESATERIGTATAWVEVPDLSKGKLTLSAILIARNSETQRSNEPAAAQSMSPAVTQGVRVYKRGEVLTYNLMVYPAFNKNEVDNQILMQTSINQGEQQIYQSQWQPVSSLALEKNKKEILTSANIKLNNLKPGVYELRIGVRDSKSKKPVERAILFGVEP